MMFKDGAYYPLGFGGEMSEGEYELQWQACNDPDPIDVEPPSLLVPLGKWRVRGGALLEISKMSAEHLQNAIRLFEKSGWGQHEKIRELREELSLRKFTR